MKYIKGYDSLRAISILMVIAAHTGLLRAFPQNEYVTERIWKLISGDTGVLIFFTLSGFLITLILLAELSKNHRINFKNFFARRFLRLSPPLLIFAFATLTLMYFDYIDRSYRGVALALCYAINFMPRRWYTGEISHTWSLAVEEQYYLVWPFVLNFIRSKITLIIIAIFVCVTSLIFWITIKNDPLSEIYYTKRWFIPAVASIMIGSVAAITYKNFTQSKLISITKKQGWIGFIFYLFPLYCTETILDFHLIFQPLGIALILLWIYQNQESKITQILDNPYTSYIGKISYGLYVYHGIFVRTGPTQGDFVIQQFPLNIVLTIITAILSYHLIEKRILKLKDRFRD